MQSGSDHDTVIQIVEQLKSHIEQDDRDYTRISEAVDAIGSEFNEMGKLCAEHRAYFKSVEGLAVKAYDSAQEINHRFDKAIFDLNVLSKERSDDLIKDIKEIRTQIIKWIVLGIIAPVCAGSVVYIIKMIIDSMHVVKP
jgi:hypothetical protein